MQELCQVTNIYIYIFSVTKISQEEFSSTLAYSTPSFPAPQLESAYSLYPFFPAQAVLWAAKGKSYFRVRRVGRWLDAHPYEDMHALVGIEGVALATDKWVI